MQPSPLLPLQAPFFALDLAGKAQQGNLTTCTFHDSPTHKASSMTPDSPPCLPALALRLVPLVPQIEPAQPCFDLHAGAPFPRPPANKLCKTEYCGKFNFNSLYPCDSELLCVCVFVSGTSCMACSVASTRAAAASSRAAAASSRSAFAKAISCPKVCGFHLPHINHRIARLKIQKDH